MAHISKSRLHNAVFSAQVSGIADGHGIGVMFSGARLPGTKASQKDQDTWDIETPIPAEAVTEGVHSFVVVDQDDQKLGQFAIIAGDLADSDIRAELDLLRAELDMLKRAFRRHCVETMG